MSHRLNYSVSVGRPGEIAGVAQAITGTQQQLDPRPRAHPATFCQQPLVPGSRLPEMRVDEPKEGQIGGQQQRVSRSPSATHRSSTARRLSWASSATAIWRTIATARAGPSGCSAASCGTWSSPRNAWTRHGKWYRGRFDPACVQRRADDRTGLGSLGFHP